MPDFQTQKARLRSELRRARNQLQPGVREAAAHAVARHCLQLPGWSKARSVALYLAADAEVDTAPLETMARELGKQLYLPVISADNSLEFAHWAEGASLPPNRYGIGEPDASAGRNPASNLDILFLPLVGWDRIGNRLGMGGGFYDRTLAGVNGPLRVGLAYKAQECPNLPAEEWDISLDFVVTEAALISCQGSA